MTKLLRAGLVALLGFAVATPAAVASKVAATPEKGHMTVKDDAHVFDKDSVIKAEAKFHGVTFKSPTHFTVMTVDKVPASRKADFDKAKDGAAKHALMRDWVREIAPVESERGVFVLICQEVRLLEVVADRQTDLKRHFGDDNAKHLADILTAGMKSAGEAKTEDEKRAIRGEALVRATDYVVGQLKNTSAPEPVAGGTTHTDGGPRSHSTGGGMHWVWWVVIVLGVLLVIWVIVAVIRAMTGNVYGGMYGGGYGYGYGGGGPGFFGMFMGGMLGSMAGMWLYNSMMGTHYAHDPSMATGGDYGGAADGGADTGAGDYDNGEEAGGDWGNDGGAADGGAGGDWGDGGGGGGGDWGDGGGGGDWGGDGGGDFGGGGGDW